MSIRKIRNTWWVDIHYNGKRYRKKCPGTSKSNAILYESTLIQKLIKGESINIEKEDEKEFPTFKAFAEKWLETYAKPNNKASEVRNKERALRVHLVPFFGHLRVNKIPNLKVEEYKEKKTQTDICNKTINNHLTVLSTCLRTAQDWLEFEKIPKIKKLKVAPQQFDYLTQEESEQLLKHAKGIWYDVFLLLLKTGMRKGELLALTWENINWHNGQIIVSQSMSDRIITSTKSNRIRYIDMTRELYNCLYKRKEKKGFVFADDESKHFSMRRLNDTLDQICKKAGLRKITVHTLRHTFASHLAMAGAPLQAIQGLLGHADIQTTMRYAHLSKSIYKETIGLLEPKPVNIDFRQHTVNTFEKVRKLNEADNTESSLT